MVMRAGVTAGAKRGAAVLGDGERETSPARTAGSTAARGEHVRGSVVCGAVRRGVSGECFLGADGRGRGRDLRAAGQGRPAAAAGCARPRPVDRTDAAEPFS
ncbi:hypothetical protein GCM10010282_52740 [Streptomyces roseolus]|nr:hypothetical protein GCM10010282_52740 [Streptomyces roseolus]